MEPDGNILMYVFLLVALILVNAFFSMSEIAIISLNDNKVRKLAQDGNKKAKLLVGLIDLPSRFMATIQVGITLSGFLASAVAADRFNGYIVAAFSVFNISPNIIRVVSLVFITLVLSFVSLVFGELVPKRIGLQHYEKIAMAVARPLYILEKIEKPFVSLLSFTTNGIFKLIGINPDKQLEQVTEEEIRMMIDVGNESGNIEYTEKEMLYNIFEFDDRTADEMMIHRTEIEAVELSDSLEEIMCTAVESGYSRIPVYQGDLDSIVGILYVKDLLGLVLSQPDAPFCLSDYIREALFVPESTNCKALLEEFQAKKLQMAIVIDEYGGTAGLITMEDLLESIVGNIQDEYDNDAEDIVPLSENIYLVDPIADLEEVAKFFGVALSDDDEDYFDTIGGYVIHRLGYIPSEKPYPSISIGNLTLSVEEMDERRILKLRAEVSPADNSQIKSETTKIDY